MAFKGPIHKIQCRVFKVHLDQLVKSGHLKEFVVAPESNITRHASRNQENTLPPPLGVIEVIHTASIGLNVSRRKGILSVVLVENLDGKIRPRKRPRLSRGLIKFGDEYLEGTIQLHEDALVVTS